jgi:opacity protein-like surface antigen
MKKLIALAILATSLAVSARAIIVGVDAGYLLDSEEEYISARLAFPLKVQGTLTQQLELEAGITSMEDSGVKGDFLPVTVNYRLESTPAGKLGYYFGAGVGSAFVDVSGFGLSDNDVTLALQAFAGVTYRASAAVSLHAGLKYLWMGDAELFGSSLEVGDDVVLSAGISFKF